MAQNLVPKQKELTPSLPNLPEVGDKPHPPNISFPKREFGKTNTVRGPFNGNGLANGHGCIMMLIETWPSAILVFRRSRQARSKALEPEI